MDLLDGDLGGHGHDVGGLWAEIWNDSTSALATRGRGEALDATRGRGDSRAEAEASALAELPRIAV